MSWKKNLDEGVKGAKNASWQYSQLDTGKKNAFLEALADILENSHKAILKANGKDAEKCRIEGCSKAFIDRLVLTPERISGMARSVRNVALLPDPVGEIFRETVRPNGLVIKRVRVPIGLLGIIYESRPDVTVEATALCVKSGNCVILKGGKESKYSNRILTVLIKKALGSTGISPDGVFLVTSGGRQAVKHLLKMNDLIDLIIPRGGTSLIETVVANSRIPVIKHYKGVCHTYVDADADLKMAEEVCYNAKVQRPATCNAMETMLVHRAVAAVFLPAAAKRFKEAGVEMRGCPETLSILPDIKAASEPDWSEEYLDLILSIKVVADADEAVAHINRYGTRHSDAIVTDNSDTAEKFLKAVDSACVYHNASTRFTDGGEFGMGAEIGISTDKIHARGPMALEELTTYKFLVYGNGQVRK